MKIEKRSHFTGRLNAMDIDVTLEQLSRYRLGELIQDVMPDLTIEEREFIMTGVTPQEWKEAFPNDSDD